jgi:tRNA(Ile2)-agmatinylcytidine synthase
MKEILTFLTSADASFSGYKNRRGLIGATASIAWLSQFDKTYELITYREEHQWGTKRKIDINSVITIDKQFRTTFDNYDYVNNHNRIAPNSPCPVLYGIRGISIQELNRARPLVQSERVDSWILFETNQATDDHLQKTVINNIGGYQSVILEGRVSKNPWTIEGGHVFFTLKDTTGTIDCAAYEPTKEFRTVIKSLHLGDIVEVYGGVRTYPLTINMEKINIKKLVSVVEKIENPVCNSCGKHMKSLGKTQGFKCKECGTRSSLPKLVHRKRTIHSGLYEVPVCARRHLSKPLKRLE